MTLGKDEVLLCGFIEHPVDTGSYNIWIDSGLGEILNAESLFHEFSHTILMMLESKKGTVKFGHKPKVLTYKDAEKILFELGYELKVSGSHHVFRKTGYKHVTIKRRPQLLPYQLTDLQEVLRDHGTKEKI